MPSVTKTASDLRQKILKHDRLYYCDSAPEITDAEYDKLMRRLVALEEKHPELVTAFSPTQRVGPAVDGIDDCEHMTPMMSVANAMSMDALDAFHARMLKTIDKPRYCVDFKIDGLAISLVYRNGVLVRASTRGDGLVGKDVLHNAYAIGGIPRVLTTTAGASKPDSLPGIIDIRGEVYISPDDFVAVVAAREAAGKESLTHPRNAASGALLGHDPARCRNRKLRFVAHGLGRMTTFDESTYSTMMGTLNKYGIPIIEGMLGNLTYTKAKAAIERFADAIDKGMTLSYPIDGIVLKVDKFADRKKVKQVSNKHISWAAAYKWQICAKPTVVKSLDIQVGKRGQLTPVAYLEPVELDSTTVQKATLHNFSEVAKLDIRVGDTVMVEKAGKIIPHIMRVVKHAKRPASGGKIWIPVNCPACGALVRKENVHFYCTNSTCCPKQLEGVITAAAAKDRMDIPNLGDALAAELVSSGLVKSLPDLWRLKGHREAVQGLEHMGEKSTDKLLKALEKAKRRPSWRLLSSLNIRMVGRTASEKICRAIHKRCDEAAPSRADVFEVLWNSWDIRDLMAIDGIGEETAAALLDWFELDPNQTVLLAVKELGLNCGEHDPKEKKAKGPQPLYSTEHKRPLKICVTGKLKHFKREEIKTAIKAAGGISSSSVTKSLDMLVCGADAGSKKGKAEELGVTILSEAHFMKLAKIK